MNFNKTIVSLDQRAKVAGKTSRLIGFALGFVVLSIFLATLYQIEYTSNSQLKGLFGNASVNTALQERGANLVNLLQKSEESGFNMTNEEKYVRLQQTVVLLGFLNESENTDEVEPQNWFNSISSIAFSLGAIGFVVLLIQIFVQFMRYYARLAELYKAQAGSLRAADGDPEVAYSFMQHFTPAQIDIGSAPTSVYEKALETISNVAKQKN